MNFSRYKAMKISRVRTMFALGAGIDWHTQTDGYELIYQVMMYRTAYNVKLFLGQIVINCYLYSKWRNKP